MPETASVIAAMTQYLQDVLEQPHPVFGGLPICPFAKQARLHHKIDFQVQRFRLDDLTSSSPLMQMIHQFAQTRQHDVLLLIHPDCQVTSFDRFQQQVDRLNTHLQPLDLTAFGGHPDDAFNIQGVRTRQDPFLNLTIQSIAKLTQASTRLATTHYYDNWTPEALNSVGYPRSTPAKEDP
ncbi:DUF1415 family protein [Phormidesmis sp. 146-12]